MSITIKEGIFSVPNTGGTAGHLATGVFQSGNPNPIFVFQGGPSSGGGQLVPTNYPEEANGANWTSSNSVTLNVSDPSTTAADLEQETGNFTNSFNGNNAPGYSVLGQNSNTYDYTGAVLAGVSTATLNSAITQIENSSGLHLTPAASFDMELAAFFRGGALPKTPQNGPPVLIGQPPDPNWANLGSIIGAMGDGGQGSFGGLYPCPPSICPPKVTT